MTTIAVTDRLVLERFVDADAPALADLGTPEVVRYLGGIPWTVSSAGSRSACGATSRNAWGSPPRR